MSRRLTGTDWRLCCSVLQDAARKGGKQRVACPICERTRGRADAKLSLYLHADGGFVCFRCGAAGFLPGAKPRAYLPNLQTLSADTPAWRKPPVGFTPLYEGEGLTDTRFNPHRDYLDSNRVLDATVAQMAGIGGVLPDPAAKRYYSAIIVPVLDPTETSWWGWVSRELQPRADRSPYRYPPEMPYHLYLYLQGLICQESEHPIYVVEGVFDALSLYPHAVATLGKPTAKQLSVLTQARRPVVFCPDGDAWEAGEWHAYMLRTEGVRAGTIRLPPRIDPDEVPRSVIFALGEQALQREDAAVLG